MSLDAYRQAHRLAFAPLLFQAVRVARQKGLLAALEEAPGPGLGPEEAARRSGMAPYAARVLLEGCTAAGAVEERGGVFSLSPVGLLLLRDELVGVNLDFSHSVCYQGAFFLDESVDQGRPAGLKVFGPWDTIYQGLMDLPDAVRASWLAFDHCYSDGAFPAALAKVLDRPVPRLLDVGGNTGKWSLLCLASDPTISVTLLDHPPQVAAALDNAARAGVDGRLTGFSLDLLDHAREFPGGFDVVWMSQFLDCFDADDVAALLRRGRGALTPRGRLMVLETCWDLQPNPAARDAILATSLYFTCMANGRSRMFHSRDLESAFASAGLTAVSRDQLGFHTLYTCVAA